MDMMTEESITEMAGYGALAGLVIGGYANYEFVSNAISNYMNDLPTLSKYAYEGASVIGGAVEGAILGAIGGGAVGAAVSTGVDLIGNGYYKIREKITNARKEKSKPIS